MLENMINNDKKMDILYMEVRIEEFQKFIREVCIYLSENYGLPTIPWIVREI